MKHFILNNISDRSLVLLDEMEEVLVPMTEFLPGQLRSSYEQAPKTLQRITMS
jgi:hypothetical protein